MFLFLAAFASHAYAVQYTCGAWSATNATGTAPDVYSAVGSVSVFDNATGAYFTLTDAALRINGTNTVNAVVAHVHEKACNDAVAGGHFKKDITIAGNPLSNELWASPSPDAIPAAQPAGTATWSGIGSLAGYSLAGRQDIKAIIIHEHPDVAGVVTPAPKRVCCDLTVVASATTTAAQATTTTAQATTTKAPAAGTTVTGGTMSTVAGGGMPPCVTDECCAAAAAAAPNKQCDACFNRAGCVFFRTPDKNPQVKDGGNCLLEASTGAGGQIKVTELAECVPLIGCAAVKTCLACKEAEACNWCYAPEQSLAANEGRCIVGDCRVDEMRATKLQCSGATSLVASFGALLLVLAVWL
jgi:hypothetical protein